jgi:hypothetical protein
VSRQQNGGIVEDVLEFSTALGSLLIDAAEGLLTPQVLNPSVVLDLTGNPLARAVDGLRLFLAGGNVWTSAEELAKKIEIFVLVPAVAPLIDEPPQGLLPLPQMVANAYGLGDFPALWAIEGLGHDYGDRFWQQGMVPQGILSPAVTQELPSGSLPMLNAGIGLSMARMLYDGNALAGFPRGLRWDTPAEEIRRMVAEIVRLDRDNATPGYTGAAYENMGLATRLLRPTMVPAVDQAIREVAPEVRGYFWHGVGRMSYFWPVNFLPCSDWQVFQMARREAPDEAALLNAWAGAAWGYALVTQQNPEIMADLLLQLNGEELAQNGGFANGIASSMMMRFDTTPDAPFIESFIDYQPSDPRVADLWQRLVRTPAETALNEYYPVLKQGDRLGEIFQYNDLPALVAQVRGAKGADSRLDPF